MPEDNVSSTAELEVSEAQPAPAADDPKATPAATDENAETAVETTEQQEARKQSKFQRRLDRQKAGRVAAETEARILRERLDKLEAQSKPTQETGEPKREDFADLEAYIEARADWRADQRVDAKLKAQAEANQGKEKQQQANAGQEKVAKAWAEREQTFQAATNDYEAVVTPFAEEDLQNLSAQARHAIVESEVGPALLYHLANHPEEADRIAVLSPTRQIVELGKLESKVSVAAKKTTNAPAPANTTNGGRTASKDIEKMSQSEYEAYRKTQGARWAR